jgi:hypothetical protein|tara:strand:+ start:375 stop:968 length:594 start_codon:yes stop_codon:yes gene_type:complete
MDTIDYHYSDGELLDTPQDYSYSGYFGQAFVDAWMTRRMELLLLLPAAQSLNQFDGTPLSALDTVNLLHAICEGLHNRELSVDDLEIVWLERLVKRFEVSKRVHNAYQNHAPYRPVDKSSYKNMPLYLKLAECFILAFNNSGELQYLNAFIKIQDSIISQVNTLNYTNKTNLAWLIEQEINAIKLLMTNKGLTWPLR